MARARGRLGRLVRRASRPPLVSVVVAYRDAGELLEDCVARLLEQTHPRLEIVLVDDGSTDRSAAAGVALAKRHPQVRCLRQQPAGIGVARNAGVAAAKGDYLVFCDADDRVPPDAYDRLSGVLEMTGSDLAVGAATLQVKGAHSRPRWARRSNPTRMLGVSVADHPSVLANLVLGCRMFRTSFWQQHQVRFPEDGHFPDLVTVVDTLCRARSIDILPAVTYRWCTRLDGRTLLQRTLQETELMRTRLRRLREAGTIVNELASDLQGSYFIEVLHTTVPDLVRAAVTHEDDADGYWATLRDELSDLLALLTPETLARVSAEDRIIAWLCGHGHRSETEDFLEFAFDNNNGYPYDEGTRPLIRLDFLDRLARDDPDFARIAPVDQRYRVRLTEVTWSGAATLTLRGGAFIEYADDRRGPSTIHVVVRRADDGTDVLRVEAEPCPVVEVNRWAGRAHEEHSGAGFEAALDLSAIDPGEGRVAFEVAVELDIDGERRSGPFGRRMVSSSAGLLEPSLAGDRQWLPIWRPFEGLRLVVRDAAAAQQPDRDAVLDTDLHRHAEATGWETGDGSLHVVLDAQVACEVALVGPRATTDWVSVEPGRATTVVLPLVDDEWGLGDATLPENTYRLTTRVGDEMLGVRVAADLWRSLPTVLSVGEIDVHPRVSPSGALSFEVLAAQAHVFRTPYVRRRLRDGSYPAFREAPLLDSVLYETFAGKSAGDNPGALCREMLSRDTGLDVAFSVTDLAIAVPDGARKVLRFSEDYFELLGRSRYIVTNAALSYFFRRREGQRVLQTWHGSPLKQIAHDRPFQDFFNWHHRRQILVARENWDVLLSQSEFCTWTLRSAFRYSGEVWEHGYPRNDVLCSSEADEVRARTRRVLGLADEDRVVLYAPTWRDNARVGGVWQKVLYLDAEEVVRRIPGSVVLVRGHYNSMRDADVGRPGQRVIDVTRYPDIADLYLAADALVTDYSSVFFDFALTDKPMVFLAPDLVEYRDENRGFYVDYHETVPGPVCTTTDEVIQVLTSPDQDAARRARFREVYNPRDDGGASRRVNDALLDL